MTVGNVLFHSAVDSCRFGMRICRGELTADADPAVLGQQLMHCRPDIAIVRLDAGEQRPLAALDQARWRWIHADTLVHYRASSEAGNNAPSNRGFTVKRATIHDLAQLSTLAHSGFEGYRSHYHANPLFREDLILEGYVEWACSALGAADSDLHAWLALGEGHPLGFATCRIQGDAVDVLLNAIRKEARGQRVYASLLSEVMQHYFDAGLRSVHISTQVWNIAVQRAWARAGFQLQRAQDTYHIMPRDQNDAS